MELLIEKVIQASKALPKKADHTRENLDGVYIKAMKNYLSIYCCDGHLLVKFEHELKNSKPSKDFIYFIPREQIKILQVYKSNQIERTLCYFEDERNLVLTPSCKFEPYSGKMPPFDNIIPKIAKYTNGIFDTCFTSEIMTRLIDALTLPKAKNNSFTMTQEMKDQPIRIDVCNIFAKDEIIKLSGYIMSRSREA